MFARSIYYEDRDGLVLSQYIPNRLAWKFAGANVTVNLVEDLQMGSMARPLSQAYHLTITSEQAG